MTSTDSKKHFVTLNVKGSHRRSSFCFKSSNDQFSKSIKGNGGACSRPFYLRHWMIHQLAGTFRSRKTSLQANQDFILDGESSPHGHDLTFFPILSLQAMVVYLAKSIRRQCFVQPRLLHPPPKSEHCKKSSAGAVSIQSQKCFIFECSPSFQLFYAGQNSSTDVSWSVHCPSSV